MFISMHLMHNFKGNKSRHLLCGGAKLENCKKCIINSLYHFSLYENIALYIKQSILLLPACCAHELCGSLIKQACLLAEHPCV
jgi:hypothetical protein